MMTSDQVKAYAVAYNDGVEHGERDARCGIRSEYVWHGADVDAASSYTYAFSVGYRRGWTREWENRNAR